MKKTSKNQERKPIKNLEIYELRVPLTDRESSEKMKSWRAVRKKIQCVRDEVAEFSERKRGEIKLLEREEVLIFDEYDHGALREVECSQEIVDGQIVVIRLDTNERVDNRCREATAADLQTEMDALNG